MSFVHGILAKKWILYGENLMIYPHIYFRLTDRLAYQDIANFQMILSLDNNCQVFDYFLTNYGLDSQLKVLISSIKNSSLV